LADETLISEGTVRREQDRLLASFFRFILRPFHPFTADFFDRAGLPAGAIRTVGDLGKLPYLSKSDLIASPKEPEKQKQFIVAPTPQAIRRHWPIWKLIPIALDKKKFAEKFHPILLTATTGRTADPISFIYAQEDMEILAIAGRRLIRSFQLAYPDRVLSFFPYAPHLAFWQCCIAGFESRVFMLQTGGGKAMGTDAHLKLIDRIKPSAIVGVPSYTYHVLREARAAKIPMGSVQKVILGAEKVPPGMKRKIISILMESGARQPVVFSTYGFTEAKKAWGECPTTDPDVTSGYHLTPHLDLIQIADPVTGKILPPDSPGEIIYTPLRGAGTLIWRYRTGDIAEGGLTFKPCPHCGAAGPRLMGPINRVSNIKDLRLTKIKGTLVNLNNIAALLDGNPGVEEWQIEIRKKDNDPHEVDEVILYVAWSTSASGDAASQIKKDLHASCEISPNEIHVLPLAEMLDRTRMETALKEIRILDTRPKSL